MKTLQEWVDLFGQPAYIFCNGYTNKCMYFIPICEYDEVVINPNFNAFSYTQVVKDGEVICDILKLRDHQFLNGDEHIFIVPIEFDDESLPEENVIQPVKKS